MGGKTYYELLEISPDASTDDIKKQYKRLALKYHPDKNLDSSEEAQAIFTQIKDAYDVLLNPLERSWYDRHQDAFHNDEEHHNDIDSQLNEILEGAIYDGIDDSATGFFTVIRKVFEAIIDQEGMENLAKVMHGHVPEFGDSKSDLLDAKRFYDAWLAFQSTIKFTSLNKYNIRDADNRRVLRLMEKENAKIRDKARKERNKKIKDFVSFIRTKDPRMAAYKKMLEERNAANRQKSERNRRAMIARRNHEAQNYVEQEWSSMSALERELQQIEQQLDNEDDDEPVTGRDRRNKKKKDKKKNKRNGRQQYTSSEDSQTDNGSSDDEGAAQSTDQAIENPVDNSAEQIIEPNRNRASVNVTNGIHDHDNSTLEPPNEENDNTEEFHSDGLYCGPCHKTFRTDAAFNNHIRSRRHLQRLSDSKALPQDGGDELV